MNKLLATMLAIFAFTALAGCKSNIANLRNQIRPTFQEVVVEADENAAFAAALSALTQMGFNITSSGAAQRRIEAISAISTGSQARPARQITASVRVGVAPNNASMIQILFTEIREEQNIRREGMGTRQPLVDSPLYSVFAKHVNAALEK